jgi:hypothetical protein
MIWQCLSVEHKALYKASVIIARAESIFHWYLEQRKNERSGCLAGFVDVLPNLCWAAPTRVGRRQLEQEQPGAVVLAALILYRAG